MNNKHKINSSTLIKVHIFITVISIMLDNIKIVRARTSAAGGRTRQYTIKRKVRQQESATAWSASGAQQNGKTKQKNGKNKDSQPTGEHNRGSSNREGERNRPPSQANGRAGQTKIAQKKVTYTGNPRCTCGANAHNLRSNWVNFTQLGQTYGTKTHRQSNGRTSRA